MRECRSWDFIFVVLWTHTEEIIIPRLPADESIRVLRSIEYWRRYTLYIYVGGGLLLIWCRQQGAKIRGASKKKRLSFISWKYMWSRVAELKSLCTLLNLVLFFMKYTYYYMNKISKEKEAKKRGRNIWVLWMLDDLILYFSWRIKEIRIIFIEKNAVSSSIKRHLEQICGLVLSFLLARKDLICFCIFALLYTSSKVKFWWRNEKKIVKFLHFHLW